MNKKYFSRAHFWAHLHIAMLALILTALFVATGHALTGLLCLTLIGVLLNRPKARLCATTLSVPEILGDILSAFRTELPEVFGNGFATDFSSKTAVLGDQITAHISKVPASQAYVPGPNAFSANATPVEQLIQDVPVTLNQFVHVPVKVGWLTQISTKGVALYKAATANLGFALAKKFIDGVLSAASTNFSNTLNLGPASLCTLDTWDGAIRSQMNSQKCLKGGRFALVNTALANSLGLDDRVRSNLFYGARNGAQGLRVWQNTAGFSWIKEYPDFAGINSGFCGDRRAVCVAVRRADFSNVARDLGIPEVMQFYPITDEQTGLELLGVAWQEVGTGDLYVSAAILFGLGVGNQNSTPGQITDPAGLLLRTS